MSSWESPYPSGNSTRSPEDLAFQRRGNGHSYAYRASYRKAIYRYLSTILLTQVDEDETGNKKEGKATDYVDRHYMRELLTMGLLDHFHPPLSTRRHWHAFYNDWATYIASDLNRQLPEGYFAEPKAIDWGFGWAASLKIIGGKLASSKLCP
jgi:hypothetical protein